MAQLKDLLVSGASRLIGDSYIKLKSVIAPGGSATGADTVGNNQFLRCDANGVVYWGSNPNTDTHYATHLYIGASGTNTSAVTSNGGTYIKLYDNTIARESYKITGTGATSVTSDENGNITIDSTDTTTLDSMTGTLAISHGGTGKTTVDEARKALGAAAKKYGIIPAITFNTAAQAAIKAAVLPEYDDLILESGVTIALYFTWTGATNSALTLYKSDKTTPIGVANPIFAYGNTRVTTHFEAGSTALFTYWPTGTVTIKGATVTDTGTNATNATGRWCHAEWNTTYSALTVADGQTGTATTSRLVRADYLKQIIQYHAVPTTIGTTVGGMIYFSDAGTPAEITPNTANSIKFLSMEGTGSAGAAPVWTALTKASVGLGNVEDKALSTWAGTSNITTVGTITTGTWNGTTIATSKGGTGLTSFTQWGIPYASTTSALSFVGAGTSGMFLKCNGSAAPSWGNLPAAATNQAGIVQLYDNIDSTSTTYAATANAVKTAYDKANAAIPNPANVAKGDILYYDSGWKRLAKGTNGQYLKLDNDLPAWANDTASANYLPLLGGELTGSLKMMGHDLILFPYDPTSNDSADIVWQYGNGNEKSRIWTANTYTSKSGPNYRVYNEDGTQLYSGVLPLGDGTGASGTWGISITGSSASCTGNAVTATTASYLTTPNVGGYSTDQYGNITHQRTTNTDYFQMKSNDGTARLKLYMETGQTDINQGYLNIFPNSGSFTEGIRIHTYSSWTTIILCGADNTGNSGTSANSWSIHNNTGNFYITRNGSSSSSSAILKCVSNAWSCNGTFTASAFTASAGLLKITNNGNTTTIGSQNASFCHVYNSADIPFIFNNNVLTTKGSLGNATYPFANLYLKGNGNGIYYVGTKSTYRMIRFIDNTSDTYGNGISIGGGGQVIIGGGESADVAVAQAGTSGAESMWICNDGQIDLYANLQNGWNTNAHAYLNTSGYWYAVRCYNAVWNDYAECRNSNCTEPGYVVYENGDDTLSKTQIRMSHFAGIISDTFGTCMGETDDAKTPIAVAGRVLAYTYHPRDWYQPGDCVCAAPGGTVDIMTRDEVAMYPDRIVGTVSCVPDYDTWGTENVPVNGRIWIKVR